jgi:protein-disulfide isomerase
MSARIAAGRTRRAASSRPARHSPRLFIGGMIAAVAVVAGLIAWQAFAAGSDTIPERVATGEGRILGDPAAPVTVVEYADFQCPVCKRAESSIVSRIEKQYVLSGKVKIEFRMYPFLGQESFNAAQAAEAAREQGKFWEYHHALFNAQGRENSGAFAYDRLVDLARKVGLDVAAFEEALGSNKYLEAVQQEADGARDAGIASTPTFFVGDKKIVGAQDYSVFEEAIDAALEAVP